MLAPSAAAGGLAKGRVNDLRLDRDGMLWAATEGVLSRLKDGRVSTLTSRKFQTVSDVVSAVGQFHSLRWRYLLPVDFHGFDMYRRGEFV